MHSKINHNNKYKTIHNLAKTVLVYKISYLWNIANAVLAAVEQMNSFNNGPRNLIITIGEYWIWLEVGNMHMSIWLSISKVIRQVMDWFVRNSIMPWRQ